MPGSQPPEIPLNSVDPVQTVVCGWPKECTCSRLNPIATTASAICPADCGADSNGCVRPLDLEVRLTSALRLARRRASDGPSSTDSSAEDGTGNAVPLAVSPPATAVFKPEPALPSSKIAGTFLDLRLRFRRQVEAGAAATAQLPLVELGSLSSVSVLRSSSAISFVTLIRWPRCVQWCTTRGEKPLREFEAPSPSSLEDLQRLWCAVRLSMHTAGMPTV